MADISGHFDCIHRTTQQANSLEWKKEVNSTLYPLAFNQN
jgi:hypothetical protein